MTAEPDGNSGRLCRAWRAQDERHKAHKAAGDQQKLERKARKADQLASFSGEYLGGHPGHPNGHRPVVGRFTSTGLHVGKALGDKTLFELPWAQISDIEVSGHDEVLRSERFTATRIALMGPFALAFKKKKQTRDVEAFIAVLTKDGDALFRVATGPEDLRASLSPAISRARKGAEAGAQDEAEETLSPGTADPIDAIRRLGELHQTGLLTDQEFEQKKAELLGKL